jgi:ThiS family.
VQVEVRFICAEIVGPLRSGPYEIPEGSNISDLLELSRSEYEGQLPQYGTDMLIFLINGKPALLDAVLSDGDKVHILRKIFGG